MKAAHFYSVRNQIVGLMSPDTGGTSILELIRNKTVGTSPGSRVMIRFLLSRKI